MKSVFKNALIASAALSLSGCYSFTGVPQLINGGGVVNQQGTVSKRTESLKNNFRYAVEIAAADRDNWNKVGTMMDTGYLLAYSNCDDFFRVMGLGQRDSSIARDLVAPVISILTGVIALKDFQNASIQQDYIEIIGLGSAAYVTGLDVYDKHFLFGSENIYEVENLTLDALDTSEDIIRSAGTMNFERAVQKLIRHQGVCTPASIKSLTKQAIAAGNVVPSRRIGTGLPSREAEVLAQLGTLVGKPGEVSQEEAAALWWLYAGSPQKSGEVNDYAFLDTALSQTNVAAKIDPAADQPYDRSGAPDEALILAELRKLSPETVARFTSARDMYRSDREDIAARPAGYVLKDGDIETARFVVPPAGGGVRYGLEVE